ncbi:MAG: helix-turn-helix domain-containing protein [Woeseiaceae bacterium]|nr:helix-turn-helix domain-containing protein [Woeseiaceae bacterium]
MSTWVSTKRATELLGVGATTVKRWADDGLLPFYRTAGGHRRFELSTVRQLAASGQDQDMGSRFTESEVRQWFGALLEGNHQQLRARLRELASNQTDWFGAAECLSAVSRYAGRRWADQECSTLECGLATSRLMQIVCAEATAMDARPGAPPCMVASVAGDRHNVGPMLAELCLRSRGFNAYLLYDELAAEHLVSYLPGSGLDLLVLSASAWQSDALSLERYYRDIAAICQREGVRIVLGGDGAWPSELEYGYRCRTFTDLRAAIDSMDAR